MAKQYDASSIVHLEYPTFIQKKPGMYVGETDSRGLTHLAKEVIGNAIDEAFNKHATEIGVHISKAGVITVSDNGRGIPVGPHKSGRDVLEVVFCSTHAGGKMDEKSGNYAVSLGTHGLGLKLVNALSEQTEVWCFPSAKKKWFYMRFNRGVAKAKKPTPSKPPISAKRGTIIRFKPDLQYFDKGSKLNPKAIQEWLEEMSWFVPAKFVIKLEGQSDIVLHKPKGLASRFEHECNRLGVEPLGPAFVVQSMGVQVAMGWTSSSETYVYTSVAGSKTPNGGTHLQGFTAGLKDCFAEFAKRGDDFSTDSLQAGLVAIVNVNIPSPKFNSQDKVKLITPEAKDLVYRYIYSDDKDSLYYWLSKNKDMTRQIIDRANELTRLYEDFRANKALAASLKASRGKSPLPASLKASSTKDDSKRELYLVEGQSAGGTAISARDASFQEILMLTGKIPNSFKMANDKVVGNNRVVDILKSIGYDPNNPTKFRVGKLILLMDSDEDGVHINALMMGLIQRLAPSLFEQRKVFIVDAPLFLYRADRGRVYGPTRNNIVSKVTKLGLKFDPRKLTRLKGWGEASSEMLREVAFTSNTRKLIRVKPLSGRSDLKIMVDMLGEGTEARKELLGI